MLPDGVRLIHIRHGQTDWNVEGRLQGQLDIPINALGREQAAANGARLRDLLAREGLDPARLSWFASPLGRARETMRLVCENGGFPGEIVYDDRLKEVAFGDWSGFTYAELKENGQAGLVRQRKADKWGFRPPGGETYAELAERVGAWLSGLDRDTVAVTHGGVFRVLHGHLCGTPWHEVPGLPAPQDRVAVFSAGRVDLV
jgi:probable phosphoglycerate mutase